MSPVEQKLNYKFKNTDLFKRAMTHVSFSNESGGDANEVYEFLGDAVLDLVLAELLIKKFPNEREGELSKRRASMVNAQALFEKARQIGLENEIIMGKGEMISGGNLKPRLLASAYEALLASIFLDSGYQVARDIIAAQFQTDLSAGSTAEASYLLDYKTRLQEIVQKTIQKVPLYKPLEEIGPPHDKYFRVGLLICNVQISDATGKSKKSAEQNAAQFVLEKFKTMSEEQVREYLLKINAGETYESL